MKKSELRKIIREEIRKLTEGPYDNMDPFELAALDYYYLYDGPKEVEKKLRRDFPKKSSQEIKKMIKKVEADLYPRGANPSGIVINKRK